MSERLDRAVMESARYPAPVRQHRRHLVDDLLAFVVERGRHAAQDRLDLGGRQPDFLGVPLMRGRRIGRMPVAGDDADGNLALALAERVAALLEMRAEWARDFRKLRIVH